LHHVINMRRNANILIELPGSFVSRNARLRFPGHSRQRRSQTKQNDPMQRTQGHEISFPGNGRMLARNEEIVKHTINSDLA